MNPNPGPGVSTSFLEGKKAIYTVMGEMDIYISHLQVQNAATSAGYMLVDLSNTATFPHDETGHIDVYTLHVNANPDAAFVGELAVGFITAAGTADADFNSIYTIHMERAAGIEVFDVDLHHGHLDTSRVIGPVNANDVRFGTAVNNVGPNGANFTAGNGDLVAMLTRSAGAIDFSIVIEYDTHT